MSSLSATPAGNQPAAGLPGRAATPARPSPAVAKARTAGAPRVASGSRARPAPAARWGRGVARRDLLFVTMQLAIMTRTGIDVATALDSLATQSRSPVLRDVLRQVHDDVFGGLSFAEALGRHPGVFSQTYTAVVAAGEASGKLPEVLSQLAQLQRGELRLHGSIRTLLGYPALLAAVCLLVLASLVLFVLPNFAEIFADSEVPLPLLTKVLLAVANELRARYWLWLPILGGSIAAAVAASRLPAGRQFWDRLFLEARLLRDVTRSIVAGRAFRLLATMLDSGVPLLEALGLVTSSVGNSVVRKALATVQNDVLNGRGMASSLMAANVMPPSAAEMIGMAERTGSLALVSRLIGEYYEEEGESRLRALVGLLEPAIVVVMGAVVALVVLSVMLPMFDLVTIAQQAS